MAELMQTIKDQYDYGITPKVWESGSVLDDRILGNMTSFIFHPKYGYCETFHEINVKGQ